MGTPRTAVALLGAALLFAGCASLPDDPNRLCPPGMELEGWDTSGPIPLPICVCRDGLIPRTTGAPGCEEPPPPPTPAPTPTPPPPPPTPTPSPEPPPPTPPPAETPTPPPGPEPTPAKCPIVQRQGLNLRIHNPQENVHVHDTTTIFGTGNGGACNEEHNRVCGGRKCEPSDRELRLRLRVPHGLSAVQSVNRFHVRVLGFAQPHGSYWLEVCFGRGQVAQAGDRLDVAANPCTRRTFTY